jgi:hypothetical protein
VVEDVLDHLSLSGYVSPLKKKKPAAAAAAANGPHAHPAKVGGKATKKKRSASTVADDDEEEVDNAATKEKEGDVEEEIAVGRPQMRGRGAAKGAKKATGAVAQAAQRVPRIEKDAKERKKEKPAAVAVAIDIGASFHPPGMDDECEDEDEDEGIRGRQEAVKKPQAAAVQKPAAKPSKAAAKKAPPKTPKAAARASTQVTTIGGLRMPLATIQDPKRVVAVMETEDGVGEGAGVKKKRRLLNQGALPGADTLPASLLFGLGDGFTVPKLKH